MKPSHHHLGGTVRTLIAAACATALALAGSAATGLASAPSTDLAMCCVGGGEVAVEGITLDHEGFEIG
jgi:hypothetical protein